MHYLLIGSLFFYCGLLSVLFGDGPFMLGSAAETFEKERLRFAQLATRSALITKILYLSLWFYGSNNGLWGVKYLVTQLVHNKIPEFIFFFPWIWEMSILG